MKYYNLPRLMDEVREASTWSGIFYETCKEFPWKPGVQPACFFLNLDWRWWRGVDLEHHPWICHMDNFEYDMIQQSYDSLPKVLYGAMIISSPWVDRLRDDGIVCYDSWILCSKCNFRTLLNITDIIRTIQTNRHVFHSLIHRYILHT